MTAAQDAPRLDGDVTAEQAVPLVLIAAAREFALRLSDLLIRDDPEGPHGSRVALRRLLAALVAFEPIIAPKLASGMERRLKGYFRVIGQLRDADVLAHDIVGAGNTTDLQAEADQMRSKVRKALLHKRADHLAAFVEKRFGGKDWQRRTPAAKAARRAPVRLLAAAALDGGWVKCLAHGADLASMTVAKRHELRKALKTFRYLCEHFAALWPDEQVRPFLVILRGLQDDLGRLNDLAMARSRGIATGDVGEAAALQSAQTGWSQLAASAKWWL